MLPPMPVPRAPFVWLALWLATPIVGCAFLLPDRIHWTVEPDASNACAEATPSQILGVAL
jgi:hypothetical protein